MKREDKMGEKCIDNNWTINPSGTELESLEQLAELSNQMFTKN